MNQVKQKLKNNIESVNKDIISIDEASFELGTRPNYGWSKKGKRCIMNVTNIRKRYSLVMAISKNRIINYKIINGSFNGESFKQFIINDVIPFIKYDALLMDNARIHRYKGLIQYLTENNIANQIIYNIPYCPEYNPIEYVFNTIKTTYKRSSINTLKNLKSFLDKINKKLNKQGFNKYFEKSFNNLSN